MDERLCECVFLSVCECKFEKVCISMCMREKKNKWVEVIKDEKCLCA